MPRHIARVIELNGGNSYGEGRSGAGIDSVRPYIREARLKAYQGRKAGLRPGSSEGLEELEESSIDDSSDIELWESESE